MEANLAQHSLTILAPWYDDADVGEEEATNPAAGGAFVGWWADQILIVGVFLAAAGRCSKAEKAARLLVTVEAS